MSPRSRRDDTAQSVSSWRLDRNAKSLGGVRHPTVVGDDSAQVRSDNLRGCKVDRIETAQLDVWGQRRGAIEHLGAQQDLVEAGELATCLGDGSRATHEDRSHHLDPRQRARHELVGSVTTQEPPQRLRLRLSLDKLHQRRRVEVEPQRSSARIAASRAEAAMP